jgi:2-oxoglutarate/2-oxoacid ferredoxin oxidoreductase subunit alpha
MSERTLMGGNIAIAEGAILAGCGAYFGYPITPQNDLLEHMAQRLPAMGRVFLQTESELAAINMVYGAAATGVRVMTSTSSPGFSLQQEGISYMAGAEVPCVVANIMRAGPGLGNIGGAQGDYMQCTRGGGHGDYYLLTLAPSSVQEMMDLTMLAFEMADKYRNPTLIMADGFLGQAMESIVMRDPVKELPAKKWAISGAKGREKRLINSFEMNPLDHPKRIKLLLDKWERMRVNEVRYEGMMLDDAEIVLVAYGSVARAAMTAMKQAREKKLKVGLLRPITVFPFPSQPLADLAEKDCKFLVAEMSGGQMLEDVRIAVGNQNEIRLVNTYGGVPLTAAQIFEAIDLMM